MSVTRIKRPLDFVFLSLNGTATYISSLGLILALILVGIHCIQGIALEEQGEGQINMFRFHCKLLVNKADMISS